MDLPIQYVQNMQSLLGEEYPEFAASFSCEPTYGIRVNELKINKDDISNYLDSDLEKIPYVENGFFMTVLKEFPNRHFTMQDYFICRKAPQCFRQTGSLFLKEIMFLIFVQHRVENLLQYYLN